MSTAAVSAIAKGVVMRPDEEVAVRASEKTAAFTSGPAGHAPAAQDTDKTLVMAAPAAHSSSSGAPGYDPAHKTGGGDTDAFDKTALIRQPAGPASPAAGEVKSDPEG
jgi:hypothetical protein